MFRKFEKIGAIRLSYNRPFETKDRPRLHYTAQGHFLLTVTKKWKPGFDGSFQLNNLTIDYDIERNKYV